MCFHIFSNILYYFCTIYSFIVYPEMLDDLVAHINYFTYMLVAFSTGTLSQRCKGTFSKEMSQLQ